MALKTHFDEDTLERYSLGRLTGADAGDIEEHILTCRSCQELLERTDDFVRAFFVAVGFPPGTIPGVKRPSFWRRWLSRGWGPTPLGGAVALAAMALAFFAPRYSRSAGEATIEMASLRGGAVETPATPERRLLRLELDAKALTRSSYRIELADERGRQLWQSPGPVAVQNEAIQATISHAAPEGLYWVRLYDPFSGQLAREYGLRAR